MRTLTSRQIRPDTQHVQGICCHAGHFNHPSWRHCRTCGALLLLGTEPAWGSRPVVGMLVRADGLHVAVSGPLLLVRRDAASAPTCVPTSDRGRSEVRVRLDFDGWAPMLAYVSAGVELVPPGGPALRLVPGSRVALHRGWTVRFAGGDRKLPRAFVYEPLGLDPPVATPPPESAHRRHRARRSRLPDPAIFLRRSTP